MTPADFVQRRTDSRRLNARRAPRAQRVAMTLAELLVSLGAASILMTAMMSAVLVAQRSLDVADLESTSTPLVADRVDALIEEIADARVVVSARSDTVTLLAEPLGDSAASPRRVQYAWSGVGAPVTRQVDAQSAENWLDPLDAFEQQQQSVERALLYPGAPTPLVGGVLAESFDSLDYPTYAIVGEHSVAQFLVPEIPAEADSLSINQVYVYAAATGSPDEGRVRFELRYPDAEGLPSGRVIAHDNVQTRFLPPAGGWLLLDFGIPAMRFPRDQAFFLVVSADVDNAARFLTATDSRDLLIRIDDAVPQTWVVAEDRGLHRLVVADTYTQGSDQRYAVSQASQTAIAVAPTGDSGQIYRSRLTLPREPKLLGRWYEYDGAKALSADLNADGEPDINSSNFSSAISRAEVFGEVTASRYHAINPAFDLDRPTEIELVWRMHDGVEPFLTATMNAGSAGASRFRIEVREDNDNARKVILSQTFDDGSVVERCACVGFPSIWLRTKLIIDPAARTVAIWVADVYCRTVRLDSDVLLPPLIAFGSDDMLSTIRYVSMEVPQ